MTYNQAKEKLAAYSQEHILQYFDTLSEDEKALLLAQIEKTDFSPIKSEVCSSAERGKITPMPAMQLPEIAEKRDVFKKTGLDIIRAGKVGAVLLAGGMGTRLGSDNPKGMFDIGVTRRVYIFERVISNLLDTVKEAGCFIHLFVMTSEKNDTATRGFFSDMNYFGYNRDFIHFFEQDTAPATDYSGKVYMESPYRISTSPNGNGGWFASMVGNGLLSVIRENGIEWLNVFAVDNVLQRIADPVFIGATATGGYSVGAKCIRKNAPDEHVGVMCLEDGKPSIIEYYELTPELTDTLDEKGEPAYNFGVILNYLFREPELERILEKKLPLHRVEKKIPYMNEKGELVKPEKPNGYKYENLVLDMINMLDTCLPYEVVREYEFAPIKNKTGIDSVESARALLEKNGFVL